jgi:hypothetical protein
MAAVIIFAATAGAGRRGRNKHLNRAEVFVGAGVNQHILRARHHLFDAR